MMDASKHNRMLPLLLLHFLCQWRFAVAQQCSLVEGQPTCVCDTGEDGISGIVNITSLASTDTSSPTFTGIAGPRNYKYSYNPCFGFTDNDCTQAAGCQYGSGNPVSTGSIATETFQYSTTSDGSTLLTLQYSQGTEDRKTVVWLICDQSADAPTILALGEVTQRLTYEFNLTTKCACPGVCATATDSPTDGPSNPSHHESPVGYIGLVLIMVSIAAFITYFIVGAIVSKFKMNKTGLDIIPNKFFWKDFPFLLKDGCLFVMKFFLYTKHLVKARFTSSKYASI